MGPGAPFSQTVCVLLRSMRLNGRTGLHKSVQRAGIRYIQSHRYQVSGQFLGPDSWATNWANLLSSKTQEAAYSYLKTFVGPEKAGFTSEMEMAAMAGRVEKRDRKEGDEAEEEGEEGPDAVVEIPARETLRTVSFCGMGMIEASEDYRSLFGQSKEQVSSLDLKLLEMRLELFLWDRVWGLGLGLNLLSHSIAFPRFQWSLCPLNSDM